MRFGEERIGLNRTEMDLLLDISNDTLTALGCSALRRLVIQAQAQAEVDLIIDFYKTNRRVIRSAEIPIAQHKLGDSYASIPDSEDTRKMLLKAFAFQSYDDTDANDVEYEINQVRSATAAEAVASLDVEVV